MTDVWWFVAIIAAGALAAAITAIWILIARFHAVMRRVSRFLDDWYGTETEPGIPARVRILEDDFDGMRADVSQIETDLTAIRDQLRN